MPNILDGLVEKVHDAALRSELAYEIARLRETKEFGLVFDRHLPECVRLPAYPVSRGAKVQLRADTKSSTMLVRTVKNGIATVVDSEGRESELATDDLMVVSEFGEPIFPGLISMGRLERGEDTPFHIVVDAENYHALEALTFAYAGQVDLIYADPPYNTGDRNWQYNNDYVDRNDAYRHSKWLSFMEKRLWLSKVLLKPATGALVVTIDQREVSHLGVLLDDLFRGYERQLVTIVINASGQPSMGLNRVEEYAYIVTPPGLNWGTDQGDNLLLPEPEEEAASGEQVKWENLLRRGTSAARADRFDMFYPIWIEPSTRRVMEVGEPLDRSAAPTLAPNEKGWVPVWPFRSGGSEGRWRVGRTHASFLASQGFLRVGSYNSDRNSYSVTYLVRKTLGQIEGGLAEVVARDSETGVADVRYTDPSKSRPKTVWYRSRHNASEHGTNLLTALIGERRFTFPKSLYAVADTIRLFCQDNPSALVLDFFGGSGTTTHAVALLNAEDGGGRRSILVTNNELDGDTASALKAEGYRPGDPQYEARGVFQYVTRPRLEAAFSGRQALSGTPLNGRYVSGRLLADGLGDSLEFFQLVYLDRNAVSRGKAFEAIAPLLWMKAGAAGPRVEKEAREFALPENGRYGILFDVAHWRAFADALDVRPDMTHAFVVTDSLAQYQQVAAELPPGIEVSMLYEDYLRNFEINTRQVR